MPGYISVKAGERRVVVCSPNMVLDLVMFKMDKNGTITQFWPTEYDAGPALNTH